MIFLFRILKLRINTYESLSRTEDGSIGTELQSCQSIELSKFFYSISQFQTLK